MLSWHPSDGPSGSVWKLTGVADFVRPRSVGALVGSPQQNGDFWKSNTSGTEKGLAEIEVANIFCFETTIVLVALLKLFGWWAFTSEDISTTQHIIHWESDLEWIDQLPSTLMLSIFLYLPMMEPVPWRQTTISQATYGTQQEKHCKAGTQVYRQKPPEWETKDQHRSKSHPAPPIPGVVFVLLTQPLAESSSLERKPCDCHATQKGTGNEKMMPGRAASKRTAFDESTKRGAFLP